MCLNTTRALIALTTIACSIAGCRTYEPEPLDLEAHRRAWLDRTPTSESVLEFARRLDEQETPVATFDPADGVTLPEAEVIALVFNPDLRLARGRARIASATAENAGLWEDPVFAIDVLRITESVANPWVITPGLAFTIPLSGRLGAEKDQADAAFRTELYRIAEAEWNVRTDLRREWASWSAARMRLEETEAMDVGLQSLVDSTSRLSDVGELPRPEAALFVIEQARRRNELRGLRGDIEEGEQRIRALMGLSPDAPVELVAGLGNGADATRTSPGTLDGNLTLARLREAYDVAEQSLRREILKQYPDLTIGPLYETDQGQSRIGFLGAIPLPVLNANRQGIAEAEAERELARAAFETEYERTVGDVAAIEARLDALQAQRDDMEQVVIPLVDRQIADANQLLRLGESGALVLLDSLRREFEIKLQLIDIRLGEVLSENEIRALTGPEPGDPMAALPGSEVTP